MPRHKSMTLILTVLLAGCGGSSPAASSDLPSLNALPEFTVSGISSGAYLAGQLHVAYSADVAGAGLVAGGPWGCADGSMARAFGPCISGDEIDVAALSNNAAQLAAEGFIDSLANLAGDKVFLFHGEQDVVVPAAVSNKAAAWYQSVAPGSEVAVVDNIPATHGWPTVASGVPCGEFAEPWINACGYDLAGEMLQHLLGPLNEPVDDVSALNRFSQAPFKASSMGEEGLLFVPPKCENGLRCRVHVMLHGCNQAESQIGPVLAEQSGLLRWAAANDLIVLFPQAEASNIAPMNPLACWDWWGYSGANYLHKEGAQVQAIRAMVARLQDAG
ncbi:MAG: hypothetical protein HKN35_05575 [Woeseia sp.]|nr:hypothetical protein [Woeseia sp.]MBT8097732.1 hypothetical protein [Woeseia sp.]NNE60340.1 hypothetical protein [Woeseia sp.]NNL53650.1 hypothetical protein [Woeseia sp.]